MSAQVDYYKILGVSEDASDEEIKRAYRELAKRFHPDSRGGDKAAEERFKQISEAYNVLGNKKKRAQYDMIRRGGFPGGNFPGGNYQYNFGEGLGDNLHTIFSNLFGGNGPEPGRDSPYGSNPFEDLFGSTRGSRQSRGQDMEAAITIPFDLAVNGGETIVTTGSGKRVKVKIQPGVDHGTKLRLRGHGGPSPSGGPAGDLYVTVNIAPHPEFERKGVHIYSTLAIDLVTAILGGEANIRTISGKTVKLKIPAGTDSGKRMRIPRMGVKTPKEVGDHYVKIEIKVPKNLTLTEKRDLKNWAKKIGLI